MKRKGITIEDVRVGAGAVAEKGSTVRIRYDGFLSKGDRFQHDMECSFRIGARLVIAGLEYGVEGMRVGGRRRIKVGPHLAYRDEGVPGVVPPNAVLIFVVELLAVE